MSMNPKPNGIPSATQDQSGGFQADMAITADDQMIMHRDVELLGGGHDFLMSISARDGVGSPEG